MKSFFAYFCLVVLLIGTLGCSQVRPFIDARREAGTVVPVGSSTKSNPVVCYGLFGDEAERLALAQSVCDESGKTAVLQNKEYFSCKLLTPVKEKYSCQVPQK